MNRKEYLDNLDKCKNKDCTSAVRIAYIDFLEQIIKKLELQKMCDGCIHKPKDNGHYYEPCDSCSRFFGDHYETDEDE